MNSQEYIIEGLKGIVFQYPFVQCVYQFDRFCNLHSVQVLPKSYLNDPDGFGDLQYDLKKSFGAIFPYERLSFFTLENTIEIIEKNIVATINGKFYKGSNVKDIELFPEYQVHIDNIDKEIDRDANYALAA